MINPIREIPILKDIHIQRFFEKVLKTDTCWLWIRCINSKGYGMITINNKPYLSHRISWVIHNGNIPNNLLVLHKCDIPACVNPEHLFLGTFKDNSKDCANKSRLNSQVDSSFIQGEKHGSAKLTEKEVLEIRESTEKLKFLSNKYNVHINTISKIRLGKLWKHLIPELKNDNI
jgi:HNH endonuclease